MIWSQGQLLQSGKYRIIRELGRGGFGLTYLAEVNHFQLDQQEPHARISDLE